MAIIYVVTNTANGKQYVGQTRMTIQDRWRAHRSQGLKWSGRPGTCRLFHSAIHECGPDVFTIKQLRSLPTNTPQREVDLAETRAITSAGTLAPAGYNLTIKARGPGPHTPEARAKISAANKGKRLSPEHCQKIRASKLGKPRSAKTRAKVSATLKGRKLSAQTRARLSAALKGRKHSPEHRENLAKAIRLRCKGKPSPTRGVPLSLQHREKVRAGMTAFYARQRAQTRSSRSPETIAKLRAVAKALWSSPEHRKRMSEAHRGKPWTVAQRRAREQAKP